MLNKDEINLRLKKSLQGKVPKLKCIITGIERSTSMDFLKTKEEKFGSIENYVRYYISSDAIKLLKEGKEILEIQEILKINNFAVNNDIVNEARKYYDI